MKSALFGLLAEIGCRGLNWNRPSMDRVSLTWRRKVESNHSLASAWRPGPLSAVVPPYSRLAMVSNPIFGKLPTPSAGLGGPDAVCPVARACSMMAADCAMAAGAAARKASAAAARSKRRCGRRSLPRGMGALLVGAAAPVGHPGHVHVAGRRRPDLGVVDLDLRHHAFVLMLEDVAVIHEAADDLRIGESQADLQLAVDRHVHRVDQSVEPNRLAVEADHLELDLVDVEGLQRRRSVADLPLLV